MDEYRAMQREFHPKVPGRTPTTRFRGFERLGQQTVVILAQDGTEGIFEGGELHFAVPSQFENQFRSRTSVHLFLFPPGSLLGERSPFPSPRLFTGNVTSHESFPGK